MDLLALLHEDEKYLPQTSVVVCCEWTPRYLVHVGMVVVRKGYRSRRKRTGVVFVWFSLEYENVRNAGKADCRRILSKGCSALKERHTATMCCNVCEQFQDVWWERWTRRLVLLNNLINEQTSFISVEHFPQMYLCISVP